MNLILSSRYNDTHVEPDIVALLGWTSDLHLSLWCGHYHTILVQARRHRIWVQDRSDALNICCETSSVSTTGRHHNHNIPLFAMDSVTLDEPGSAELQYKVFV